MTWNDSSWKIEREEIRELREYASKFELLTKEEEFKLTSEYYDLVHEIIPLAFTIKLQPPLLNYLVWRRDKCSAELIDRNLKLVLKACQSPTYVGRGLPIFDLFMAGYDGLQYGVKVKFNPRLGWRLSTYITPWIHQRIGRAIRKTGSSIKVAGHKEDLMSKIRMVVREFVALNQGKPGPETISLLIKKKYDIDIEPEEVSSLGRLKWNILSLDENTTDDDSGCLTMGDFLAAPDNYEPENVYEFQEMKDTISRLMTTLTDDERIVVSYSYGLVDSVNRKPKQIAKLLGMTEKEVKDKISAGTKKMQEKVKGEKYFE